MKTNHIINNSIVTTVFCFFWKVIFLFPFDYRQKGQIEQKEGSKEALLKTIQSYKPYLYNIWIF